MLRRRCGNVAVWRCSRGDPPPAAFCVSLNVRERVRVRARTRVRVRARTRVRVRA